MKINLGRQIVYKSLLGLKRVLKLAVGVKVKGIRLNWRKFKFRNSRKAQKWSKNWTDRKKNIFFQIYSRVPSGVCGKILQDFRLKNHVVDPPCSVSRSTLRCVFLLVIRLFVRWNMWAPADINSPVVIRRSIFVFLKNEFFDSFCFSGSFWGSPIGIWNPKFKFYTLLKVNLN